MQKTDLAGINKATENDDRNKRETLPKKLVMRMRVSRVLPDQIYTVSA